MKKTMKKTLALVLALVMASSCFICSAAFELNDDAVAKHKGQYKNYLLLGDSVASGFRDEMSENDEIFNENNQQTVYYRVPGSYADVLTSAIIEDNKMTSFAAPGFRTIEMRYMLEDDFDGADFYLFHPAQLKAVGYAGSEEYRAAFKKAIADADLISLGIGGNDWGAYLSWVVADVMEKENVADKYINMLKEYIENNDIDMSSLEKMFEIAHLAGALPELLATIPKTLEYGLGNFYKNWDIMIQDIYDLNPDVTLMVVGMSDNSYKGKYFDYNGVTGEPVENPMGDNEAVAKAVSTVVELIMAIANKPMIDGAETFGYTFVDIKGATYVDSHLDEGGHVFVANKIIEALPDPEISVKFQDVKPGHKNYNAVEYVILNGIMTETSATTFSPDAALTSGQLAAALNKICGTDEATDGTDEVNVIKLASSLFSGAVKKGFAGIFKGIVLAFDVLSDNGFGFSKTVTRGAAAEYLMTLGEI